MSLSVEKVSKNKYTVTVERTIELGSKFNISPSFGYAGVDPGAVVVVDIITPEDYKANPHRFPDITEFRNTSLCSNDDEEGKEEIEKVYGDTTWVVYKYKYNNKKGWAYTYCFPIEEFITHISDIS